MSLAEVVRRGVKYITQVYPPVTGGQPWCPPTPSTGLGRRTIIDTRLALTLLHHGVTEFATANTRHFQEFGFSRVWNPAADAASEPGA